MGVVKTKVNQHSRKTFWERRDFIKIGAASAAGFWAGSRLHRRSSSPPMAPLENGTNVLGSKRILGKTGQSISLIGLGGQAALELPNNGDTSISIIEQALNSGINYIDTAASYGGAERWSQRYIGQVMKSRRSAVFLASKTHDRTRDGSLRLLEESLRLLQTDHLDLWQIHNLEGMDQIERIFAQDGAVQALIKAKDEGMVRFLGITGHYDPAVLIEAIKRFPFDTVLTALNAADKHHSSFLEHLLPLALENQMGIIGMKVMARGRILSRWRWQDLVRFRQPGTISARGSHRLCALITSLYSNNWL